MGGETLRAGDRNRGPIAGFLVHSVGSFRGRRGVKHLLVAALLAPLIVLGTAGVSHAANCPTSGPADGSYTVTLCFDNPADGSTASGAVPVTVTPTFGGTSPGIQRMRFYLDGAYLLTDYEAPYTFSLPSDSFVDGLRTLEVEALMRDGFVTQRASISLTFQNGVTTPPPPRTGFSPTSGTSPPPGRPLILAATGDGAGGQQAAADVTSLIASWNPNLFFYLGDVYEKGTGTEFLNWYQPNTFFGRFYSITDPTVGNHEYENGQAPGYFDYWRTPPHYYSFNAAGWHLISLDSNTAFGQTQPGSAQYQWLQQDLQASGAACKLAFFHHPLYNIGEEGPSSALAAIWALLAQHGVDIVLTGHDHTYQRWVPLDGSGNPSAGGPVEIVVGTGGHGLGTFPATDSRVAVSIAQFGATRLELNPEGAGYQFVNTQGSVLDSGSVACSQAADTTLPTNPSGLSATATYKTQIDLAWTASTDNVGVTGYEVWRDGSILVTTGPQTSYSDTSVGPGSTHEYQVRALDAAGNISGFSNFASATTPTVAVLFHDGFETGDLSRWTSASGLVTQQQVVFAGSWAARATGTDTASFATKQLATTESNLYVETRFHIVSQSTNANFLRFRTAAGAARLSVFVNSNGRLGYRNDVTGVSSTGLSTSISPGTWHTVQVHVLVNGASSQTEVWLDGTKIDELSKTEDLGTLPIGRLELGNSAINQTYDVALDELSYDRELIADLKPPTAPANLAATAHSGLRVDLGWSGSSDDIAVAGYDVYRNGTLIGSTPGAATSYIDLTVSPRTGYTYAVKARDPAGNRSDSSNSVSLTTPAIFADDFESGGLAKWTSINGLTTQQAVIDSGSWAARATNSPASAYVQLDTGTSEVYYRVRVNLLSLGPNSVSLLRFRTSTSTPLASVFVSSTGKVSVRDDTVGAFRTSTSSLGAGWHEIQARALVNGASSQVDVWLDGVRLNDISGAFDLGSTPIGRLELGDPAAGRIFDVAFDNVVADSRMVTDLGITKSADTATVPAGSPIGFVISVSNSGANQATDVHVDDPLPAGTGVDWSIAGQSDPGICSVTGAPPAEALTCDTAGLAAGGSFDVHVTSATTLKSCKAYANTATVSAANTDSHTASASTTVECPPPALALSKTAAPADAAPFQPVTYTYTATNTGGATLTSIAVQDDNGTPSVTADDFVVGTISSLDPGDSATLTKTVTPVVTSIAAALGGAGPSRFAVLSLGGDPKDGVKCSNAQVVGSVGVMNRATFEGKASCSVTGDLYRGSTVTVKGQGQISGQIIVDDILMSRLLADAQTAASFFAGLAPTQSVKDIKGTTILTGSPGLNVVNVKQVKLGRNEILTLTGPAGTQWVLNVSGDISLDNATILLGPGLRPGDVVFNVTDRKARVEAWKKVITLDGGLRLTYPATPPATVTNTAVARTALLDGTILSATATAMVTISR
jgi:uncharacterized repeat protein (TIGR01451 family)